MNLVNFWEIGGVAISVASAALLYYKSPKSVGKLDRAFAVFLGGLIVSFIFSFRFEIVPRIEKHQELANRLLRNPEAIAVSQSAADAIDRLQVIENVGGGIPPALRESYTERATEFRAYLGQIASGGRFEISKERVLFHASRMIEDASSKIVATSYVKNSDWWDTVEGRRYLDLNLKKAQRIRIERIYIFTSQNELETSRAMMTDQRNAGISVYYLFASELGYEYGADFIVIDDRLSGELLLTPDKGMRGAFFYCDAENIKRVNAYLANLRSSAKKF